MIENIQLLLKCIRRITFHQNNRKRFSSENKFNVLGQLVGLLLFIKLY